MAMRIPLPVKLMISYLVIVAIGAGPTFVYVRAKLYADLLAHSASVLVARGRYSVRALGQAAPNERVSLCRLLGEINSDRVTCLSPRGDVLYDNELSITSPIENHSGRPEVSYAMGNLSAQRAPFAEDVTDADGVGIIRRVSTSNGIDTLYVALPVVGAHGEILGVLRLATPVERIGAMTSSMVRFARNAQAVAVSLAIGFSLLAAILFVRPLQRVHGMVHALSAGDIGAQVGALGNDEVGDVGRALDQMALSLRQRLLAAGLGEALLAQLVEALPTPCVVFEESGEITAINGAARRVLCIEGPSAGKRMKDLAEHPQVRRALQAAEDEGEPEPIDLGSLLPLGESSASHGFMHVLKRPGSGPLRVFIGAAVPTTTPSMLPLPEQVEPRALSDLFAQAQRVAQQTLDRACVKLELPVPLPRVAVADACGKLGTALGEALADAAAGPLGGQATLCVELADEGTRLRLRLDAAISEPVALRIASLLTPLGGAIEALSGETRLWLPRA